MKE
ncbi:Protein of unknown function [Streptococcus thermophilus]|jgi:hypothetical protein